MIPKSTETKGITITKEKREAKTQSILKTMFKITSLL